MCDSVDAEKITGDASENIRIKIKKKVPIQLIFLRKKLRIQL